MSPEGEPPAKEGAGERLAIIRGDICRHIPRNCGGPEWCRSPQYPRSLSPIDHQRQTGFLISVLTTADANPELLLLPGPSVLHVADAADDLARFPDQVLFYGFVVRDRVGYLAAIGSRNFVVELDDDGIVQNRIDERLQP